ncbi:putative ankyrin repeat-containing domain-containing protein [Helianthus annuus]|nr:putative ankyrin repeat-containing domain-containing protein [Helianthus annuus]KAJ0556183.1 putative ankyrin repeat-containing domain-containing protein [Helianthus annuus]KAJ0562652.1 putative ankyrin repeat-containing domain-containing protein [Helianthus annuus]KAJ0728027.1 putative ankyrin repeat-containing domain-containing protein [Helianthus annuus]
MIFLLLLLKSLFLYLFCIYSRYSKVFFTYYGSHFFFTYFAHFIFVVLTCLAYYQMMISRSSAADQTRLMCKVSKSKFGIMEGEIKFQQKQIGAFLNSSSLLELAAIDDVFGLQYKVETVSTRLDDVGLWYGRKNRCKTKMGLLKRTLLMIAVVYGSTNVVKYIIGFGKADVNKVSDSDGATALHCVAAGRSSSSVKTVKLLLEDCADPNLTDANRKTSLRSRDFKAGSIGPIEDV